VSTKMIPAVTAMAAAVSVACADAAPERAEVQVRDSAGIRVVESRLAPGAEPVLRLSADPVVQIGVVEGEAEYQFDRVQGLTRLSDGTIVVANGGSSEIRYYGGDGRHGHTAGRPGAGPGEFRVINYMRRLAGDDVLVFDGMNQRISILEGGGRTVRDVPTAGGRAPVVAAALEDGTLLVRLPRSSGLPRANTEFLQDTAAFEVVRGEERQRVAGWYAGSERRMRINEQDGDAVSIQMMTLPFGRNVVTAATSDRFVIASNYRYELHLVDGAGEVRTIIRRTDVEPQPVTAELLDRMVDVEIARTRAAGRPVDEAAARRLAQSYHRVEAVPAYGSILPVQDGGVWVQDWLPPAATPVPVRWSVFNAGGELRGAVEVPARFRPLYADDEVVIGVFRDEFDVEYVRVYELAAGGG
jgi:hypothetical protein